MDLNEVFIFIKVVEAGSFSGAAKLMGLPRSTVSRKVSQLEEALGIRLLQRTTRKLSLTHAGRDYFQQCRTAILGIQQANQLVQASQQAPTGMIRVAGLLAVQRGFLCDWFNEFLKLYPNISVEIQLSDDSVDIIEAGVDVAFRAGVLGDSSLVARRLMESKLVLCASPDYLINSAAITSIDNIKQHRAIFVGNSGQNARWQLESDKGKVMVPIKATVVANSMEFAINTCLAGNGIALLPDVMIHEHLESNKLQVVLGEYSAGSGGIYIVYPSRTHLSITVRTFVDFITAKVTASNLLSSSKTRNSNQRAD